MLRLPTKVAETAQIADVADIAEVAEIAGRDCWLRLPRSLILPRLPRLPILPAGIAQNYSITGHGCQDCRGCLESRPDCPRDCQPRLLAKFAEIAEVAEIAQFFEITGKDYQDCKLKLEAKIAGQRCRDCPDCQDCPDCGFRRCWRCWYGWLGW